MKILAAFALTISLTSGTIDAQNLLLNGDFNLQNTITSTNGGEYYGAAPDNWNIWTYGSDTWVNRQVDGTYSYDSSFYMALGNSGTSGDASGVYQIVSGTAGLSYNLTVESGAQNWWWPEGEMRLVFLDASSDVLNQQILDVTTDITAYDRGSPWQSYNLSAIAPVGTTQVKVEFAADYNTSSGGGGTVFFDNAVLTVESVPEPSALGMLTAGSMALFGWCCILRPRKRDTGMIE